jgi:hypothetical protein
MSSITGVDEERPLHRTLSKQSRQNFELKPHAHTRGLQEFNGEDWEGF